MNEWQHRLLSFLMALMKNDATRYPNDLFVRLILECPEDRELQRQRHEVCDRLRVQRSIIT
jgi:hypothetical protein